MSPLRWSAMQTCLAMQLIQDGDTQILVCLALSKQAQGKTCCKCLVYHMVLEVLNMCVCCCLLGQQQQQQGQQQHMQWQQPGAAAGADMQYSNREKQLHAEKEELQQL